LLEPLRYLYWSEIGNGLHRLGNLYLLPERKFFRDERERDEFKQTWFKFRLNTMHVDSKMCREAITFLVNTLTFLNRIQVTHKSDKANRRFSGKSRAHTATTQSLDTGENIVEYANWLALAAQLPESEFPLEGDDLEDLDILPMLGHAARQYTRKPKPKAKANAAEGSTEDKQDDSPATPEVDNATQSSALAAKGGKGQKGRGKGGKSAHAAKGSEGQIMRPGSWTCTKCQAHNYSRNTVCFRSECQAPIGNAKITPGLSANAANYGSHDATHIGSEEVGQYFNESWNDADNWAAYKEDFALAAGKGSKPPFKQRGKGPKKQAVRNFRGNTAWDDSQDSTVYWQQDTPDSQWYTVATPDTVERDKARVATASGPDGTKAQGPQ
jgi:hypothetical protein